MNEFYNLPRKAVLTKLIDAHALQSWGAKNIVSTSKGIMFSVGNPAATFKGLVHVYEDKDNDDAYVVELIQTKKGKPEVVKKVKNVYYETLVDTITGLVLL